MSVGSVGADSISAHVPELSQHTRLHFKFTFSYIYGIIRFKFDLWGFKWRKIRTCIQIFYILLHC